MSTEPSIFTKIINREIPAEIIYEDEASIAILTIEPSSKGHTLVIPKVPCRNLLDATPEQLLAIITTSQKVANALITAKFGTGCNIIMNNEAVAGQKVFHAHMHIVPRNEHDGVFPEPQHLIYTDGEARLIATQLREAVHN